MTRNRSTSRIDRRTALKTLGGVALGFGGLVGATSPAAAAGKGFVGVGANTFDNDGGGADLRMARANAPDGSVATHATSGGTRTTDYATSIVSTGGVALGQLTELSYDYFGGKRNERSAPDEVWALVEDADGALHVVFRHAGASPNDQQWHTRNVLAEIRGNASLSPSAEWAELTDQGGSNVQSIGASLLGAFGAGAVLHRIGIGRGRTSGGGTVADVYYRNLRVNGSQQELFPTGTDSTGGDSASDSSAGGSSATDDSGSSDSAGDSSGGGDSAGGGSERLPKLVVVTSPGVDTQTDYVFEVTGDVENLEPEGEDSGSAADQVVDAGDRTRVEGTVGYADDRFAFSGDLIEVSVPPEVVLDVRNR